MSAPTVLDGTSQTSGATPDEETFVRGRGEPTRSPTWPSW